MPQAVFRFPVYVLIAGITSMVLVVPCGGSARAKPLPGGTFLMGNEQGDADEQPVHKVTLSPFSIHTREVTEAAYDSCVRSGRCTEAHYRDGTCRAWNGKTFVPVRIPASARNDDFPVVCVTWRQARQYCRAKGMELPTEAQWEYAARAESTAPERGLAAHGAVFGKTAPMPVGSGSPNGWGLYDMLGNVWEWVSDFYDPAAYGYSSEENPGGPNAGFYRVIRGGGWYSTGNRQTVYDRQWYSPGYSEVSIGFRCVRR